MWGGLFERGSLFEKGELIEDLQYSFIFQSSEVTHLISCQPTALKAVRLQSLVPPSPDKIYIRDLLVKNEVIMYQILPFPFPFGAYLRFAPYSVEFDPK